MNKYIWCILIVLAAASGSMSGQTNKAKPEMGLSVDYGGLGSSVVSFRMGNQSFYGLMGVGYNYPADKDDTMVWRIGIGAHIGHGAFFNTNVELKAACFSAFNKMQTWQYSVSLLPALKLTDRWELYFGPDIGYIQTNNRKNNKLMDKGIGLWNRNDSLPMKRFYLGFTVGLYYRFKI